MVTVTKNEKIVGRGTSNNPTNRFESLDIEIDRDISLKDEPRLQTQFYIDHSQSILTKNDSQDVGFTFSINPYRGCEHGCVYCYARPTHEYLGFSSGLDFESRIMVKKNAPELLRKELLKPSWQPQVIAMSGVTDCYQPVEKKLEITRQCLEVLVEFKNPVVIITKNHLITRDIDLLRELSKYNGVRVYISLTSLKPELTRILEPRTSMPSYRLEAMHKLSQAGIPVGVLSAPTIPAINDMEVPLLLKEARSAGAISAGYTLVRLPYSVKELFAQWLEKHFPDRKNKVLHRLESLHHGKVYNAKFGERMRGQGPWADQLESLFHLTCKKYGFNQESLPLETKFFNRPLTGQLKLEL